MPWCSHTTAARAPRLSDHSAISRAVEYSSGAGAPQSGARMSNRIRNTEDPPFGDTRAMAFLVRVVSPCGERIRLRMRDRLGQDLGSTAVFSVVSIRAAIRLPVAGTTRKR